MSGALYVLLLNCIPFSMDIKRFSQFLLNSYSKYAHATARDSSFSSPPPFPPTSQTSFSCSSSNCLGGFRDWIYASAIENGQNTSSHHQKLTESTELLCPWVYFLIILRV